MSSKSWQGSASDELLKKIFDDTKGNPLEKFGTVKELYQSFPTFGEFKIPTFKTHYTELKKEWEGKLLGSSSKSFHSLTNDVITMFI